MAFFFFFLFGLFLLANFIPGIDASWSCVLLGGRTRTGNIVRVRKMTRGSPSWINSAVLIAVAGQLLSAGRSCVGITVSEFSGTKSTGPQPNLGVCLLACGSVAFVNVGRV